MSLGDACACQGGSQPTPDQGQDGASDASLDLGTLDSLAPADLPDEADLRPGPDRGTGSVDDEYACELLDGGFVSSEAKSEFRKVVMVNGEYLPGTSLRQIDITRVGIGYNFGPNKMQSNREDYLQVFVDDAQGGTLLWWDHPLPMIMHEDLGCSFLDPAAGDDDLREVFDFIEPRPRYLRLVDIDGTVYCGQDSRTGHREELLRVDLAPCLDQFCAKIAAPGDPICP